MYMHVHLYVCACVYMYILYVSVGGDSKINRDCIAIVSHNSYLKSTLLPPPLRFL